MNPEAIEEGATLLWYGFKVEVLQKSDGSPGQRGMVKITNPTGTPRKTRWVAHTELRPLPTEP